MAISGTAAESHTRVDQTAKDTWEVQVSFSHLPFVYTIRFKERHAGDRVDLVCDGVTLETPDGVVRDSLLRGLADNFDRYEQHARAEVAALRENGERIAQRPVRRQRRLDKDFLQEIVNRHEAHRAGGRPPTATLAAEEGVTVGAVKNWLRRAREAGIAD